MPRKLTANEVANSLRSPNYTVRVLGGAKHSAVGWAITWGKRKLIALATQLRRSTIQREEDRRGDTSSGQSVVFDRRYYFEVNAKGVQSIEIFFNAYTALWTLTLRTTGGGLDIVRIPRLFETPRTWFREEGSVNSGRLTAIRLSSGDDVVNNITAVRAEAIADRIEYGLTDVDDVDDHTRRSLSERAIEKGLTLAFMDMNHRNQFALIKSPAEWIAEGMYPYIAIGVQFLNYDFEFEKATVMPVVNTDNPDEVGVGMSASISGTPGSFTREQRISLITISFPIEAWWRSNGSDVEESFIGNEGPQVITSDSNVSAGSPALFTWSDFSGISAGIVPAAEGAFTVEDTESFVSIPGGSIRATSTISGFVSGGVAASVSISSFIAIKTGTMPDYIKGIDLTDQVFQVNDLVPALTTGAGVMTSDRIGIDGEDHPDDAATKWHKTGTGSQFDEAEVFVAPGSGSPGSYEFPLSYLLHPSSGGFVLPARYDGTDVPGGTPQRSTAGSIAVNAFQYCVYHGLEVLLHRGDTWDSKGPARRFHNYSRPELLKFTYKRIDFTNGVASVSDMPLTDPQTAFSDFNRTGATDLFYEYDVPGTTMVATQPVRNEVTPASFRPLTPVVTRPAKLRQPSAKFPDVPVPVAHRKGVTDLWEEQKLGLFGGASLRLMRMVLDSLTGLIYSGSTIVSGTPRLQIWDQDGTEVFLGEFGDAPSDEIERTPFQIKELVLRRDLFPAIPGGGLISRSLSVETKQFPPELALTNWTVIVAPFIAEDNGIGEYILSDPQFFLNDLPPRAASTRSLTWLDAGGPGIHGVCVLSIFGVSGSLYSNAQQSWKAALESDPIVEADVAAARAVMQANLNVIYNNFASEDIMFNMFDQQAVIID